ncbi:MAG: hypothetical protein CVV07_00425 [Gammaproteobacteria bacterium HGW-Gammaproteobacteria-11]|nr:MAG: hypothetical protein CVV07_00425 [Gammaproteobacteria bacterium HGW-Gammaproteobacteria-11]
MFALLRNILSFLRAIYKWLAGLFPAFFGKLTIWLNGFLGAILPSAVLALVTLFSKLARYMLGMVAVFVAVGAFMLIINQLLKGLIFLVPADIVYVGAMFMPSNISGCITVLIIARIKSLIFFWVSRISEGMARA